MPSQAPAPGSKKSAYGWACRRCTFRHEFRSNRCAMCGALRSGTPQECHDFVLGKTNISSVEGNVVEVQSSPEVNGDENEKRSGSEQITSKNGSNMQNQDKRPTGLHTSEMKSNNNENQPNGSSNSTSALSRKADSINGQGGGSSVQLFNPYASKKSSFTAVNERSSSTPRNTKTVSDHRGLRTTHSISNNTANDENRQSQQENQNPSRLKSNEKNLGQHAGQDVPMLGSNQLDKQNTRPVHEQPDRNRRQQQRQERKMAPLFNNMGGKPRVQYGHGRRLSLVVKPFKEGPVAVNEDNAKEWIYPVNDKFPRRQYQFDIAQTAIEYNTLVSLPTGLGKTHIAAVVMFNFWRWFAPQGKVVFCAPTVPLVRQQVKACYGITGIPPQDTCVMTGKSMKPKERRQVWEDKRVFYCTPQTLQKDLESCIKEADETGDTRRSNFASQIVCLVLDEAHRASGKYAFVKVIELLESANAKFRIVGLSATPGTTIKAVQSVIEVLRITQVQVRSEEDTSVSQYLHHKQEEVVICPKNNVQGDVEKRLANLLCPILNRLRDAGVFRKHGNATITAGAIHLEREWHSAQNRIPGWAYRFYEAARALATIRSAVPESLQIVYNQLLSFKQSAAFELLKKVASPTDFDSLVELVFNSMSEDKRVDTKLIKLKVRGMFGCEGFMCHPFR